MKFTSTQENLSEGLNIVSHIASKNTTLPILNNVLIKAEKGMVILMSTNLEIGISCSVRGKVDQEGALTAQSRLIADYINLLDGTVTVSQSADTLSIESSKSQTTMKGSSAEEFPIIPEINKENPFSCQAEELVTALSQLLFAVSNSETRPEIAGIYMKFENGSLVMAATDSYRLAEKIIHCSGVETREVIVPSRAVQELSRVLGALGASGKAEDKVEIYFQDNQVLFAYKNVELVSRLVEGTYPAYRQIIPTNKKTRALITISELNKAAKASSLFSRQGIFDVRLDFSKHGLTVSAANTLLGQTKAKIEAQIEGEDNFIVLNHKFLTDGLANLNCTQVIIDINDENSPCLFKGSESLDGKETVAKEGYLYIIMPIKQ